MALMSVFGISVIFFAWAGTNLTLAVGRSILFVVVMGCVHLAGYLLYVRQFEGAAGTTPNAMAAEIAPTWWPAARLAIKLDGALLILTALILDGGRSFAFCQVAVVGHWLGVLIVALRRFRSPTFWDVIFIRYGGIMLFLLLGLIAPAVWSIIGESPLSGLERFLDK
jgi:hypothetical protein